MNDENMDLIENLGFHLSGKKENVDGYAVEITSKYIIIGNRNFHPVKYGIISQTAHTDELHLVDEFNEITLIRDLYVSDGWKMNVRAFIHNSDLYIKK